VYVPTTAATHRTTYCPHTIGSIHQGEATPHSNRWPATTGGHPIAAKWRS